MKSGIKFVPRISRHLVSSAFSEFFRPFFLCVVYHLRDLSTISFLIGLLCAIIDIVLRGFIMLKSSKNHYHVVFDRYTPREENLSIMSWVAILSKSQKLKDYVLRQCIKMASTLRVLMKDGKPSPRLVFRFGYQDNAVKDYLEYRQLIKSVHKEAFRNLKEC
jgi:hypothetical protein